MSWIKDDKGKFIKPDTAPDYVYKHDRYWFKEMLSYKSGITTPIMPCPISGKILVFRDPSGWYTVPNAEAQRQYEIWITDNILLGDDEPALE